jgi:hypothetical protein
MGLGRVLLGLLLNHKRASSNDSEPAATTAATAALSDVWELNMVWRTSRETALTTVCCVRLSALKRSPAVLANTVAFTSTDTDAVLWLSPVPVTLSPFFFLYGGADGGT